MIRRVLQLVAIALLLNRYGASAADAQNDPSGVIAFSVKQWNGDYVTSDTDVSKNTPLQRWDLDRRFPIGRGAGTR